MLLCSSVRLDQYSAHLDEQTLSIKDMKPCATCPRSVCGCTRTVLNTKRALGVGGVVFVRVCIAVKRHPAHGNSYKGTHFLAAGLQFTDLVNCRHGRKHSGTHTAMVLER